MPTYPFFKGAWRMKVWRRNTGLIICALIITAASGIAQAAERLVGFMPIKGVIIGVPKGWKSCQPFFDAKLGGAAVSKTVSTNACGAYMRHPNFKLGVYSAADPQATLYMFQLDHSPIASASIARLSGENLQNMAAKICANYLPTPAQSGKAPTSCAVRKDKLDGEPALVTTIVGAASNDLSAPSMTEVWEVPHENGLLQINITWAKGADEAIQRIKKSIDID